MNKILIPRRMNERQQKRIQIEYQKIQKYIEDGCKGQLDLDKTLLTKLPDNLTIVGDDFWLVNSKIENLNNLKFVKGNLSLWGSKIDDIKLIPNDLYVSGIIIITKKEEGIYQYWESHVSSISKEISRIKIEERCTMIDLY